MSAETIDRIGGNVGEVDGMKQVIWTILILAAWVTFLLYMATQLPRC